MNKPEVKASKLLSLILRHKPEVAHIELDSNGWADINDLIKGINKYCKNPFYPKKFDKNDLEWIVMHDDKQRYSFNFDTTKIRANQGHTLNVDVELEKVIPPAILYHGTCSLFTPKILNSGFIKSMSRLYVHMTENKKLAFKNGARWYGLPQADVFEIYAKKMYNDGFEFFKSKNNVYLTNNIPIKYIDGPFLYNHYF